MSEERGKGCQSTRHMTKSSHGQLVKQSIRHTANSSHGQLVTIQQ